MKLSRLALCSLALLAGSAACASETAMALSSGAIQCFKPAKANQYCELSAAVWAGSGKALGFSDKPSPSGNSAFLFDPTQPSPVQAREIPFEPAAKAPGKIESASAYGDGLVLIVGAFDRADGDHNKIQLWRLPTAADPALRLEAEAAPSEVLRAALGRAFFSASHGGAAGAFPYFKVESSFAQAGTLVLAAREAGETYENFAYGQTAIRLDMAVSGSRIELSNARPAGTPKVPMSALEGLSELALSPSGATLFAASSWERDGVGDGGGLWASRGGRPFEAVLVDGCSAARFSNKPEGVAVSASGAVLVLFDDDRTAPDALGVRREAGQGAFALLSPSSRRCPAPASAAKAIDLSHVNLPVSN